MCGVNGVFAYHYAANPVDEAELLRTRERMAARGPDGAGLWVADDRRVGLAHRRLAIMDPSPAGAQPMQSPDGRYTIVFNGEIYNHGELRRTLEGRGPAFASRSDTETLLRLYAAEGARMVERLRGMFAFAIHDAIERTLFLARDPYGLKPLYFADDGWTFRFASQAKALLAGGGIGRERDPAGEVGFFVFGHVPDPFTIWREIRALPAGATMTVDRLGAAAPRVCRRLGAIWRGGEAGEGLEGAPAAEAARTALLASVRAHLAGDVPVGAFLSAGVDSSALVGLMRDAGAGDIETVTLRFDEFEGEAEDEAPLAAEVARHYGTRHATRRVGRAEFEADLPALLDAMDQPSIDGVNTWFVAKAARERGLKCALSGVGGDELFGGYASFRDVPRWARRFGPLASVPLLGGLARRAARPFVEAFGLHPKAASLAEYGGFAGAYLLKRALFLPWEIGGLLPRDVAVEGLRRLRPLELVEAALAPAPARAHARVSTLESALYLRDRLLRDADWAGLAHGVEIRAPLVDPTLLAEVAAVAGRSCAPLGKAALAAAPLRPPPAAVVNRAKTGFMTPDWGVAVEARAPGRAWAQVALAGSAGL